MAEEFSEVQRYAAAGLFALALAEAQRHQLGDYGVKDLESIADSPEEIWSSRECGLCDHIFRSLKLDEKRGEILLRLARSPDSHIHLSVFLQLLLSEDEHRSEESVKAEMELDNALEAATLKAEREHEEKRLATKALLEEKRRAEQIREEEASNKAEKEAQKSEDPTTANSQSWAHSGFPSEEELHRIEKLGLGEKGEEQVLKEEVHSLEGLSTQEEERRESDEDKQEEEAKGSEEREKGGGRAEELVSTAVRESIKVRQHLRIKVLFELLTACLADLPNEKEGTGKLRPGYDARQRVALRLVAAWLDVRWQKVASMEAMAALALYELQKQKEGAVGEQAETTPGRWTNWKKGAIIGGTAVAAGAILAVTGGLAAPAIAAGLAAVSPAFTAVPLLGTALAGAVTVAGSSAAVISAFGAGGAGLAGYKMSRRMGDVEEFEFIKLGAEPEAVLAREGREREREGEAQGSTLGEDQGDSSGDGRSARMGDARVEYESEWKSGNRNTPVETGGGFRNENISRQGLEDSSAKDGSKVPQRKRSWKWGSSMKRRERGKELAKTFRPRLSVAVCISGYVHDVSEFTEPWGELGPDLESYALMYESKHLIPLSSDLEDMLRNTIIQKAMTQGAMLTVLSTLLTAMAWPLALVSATNMIDSRWTLAVDRSDKAGTLLADVLVKRIHGDRPVTLLGYSMGARVIFSCLHQLAKKGESGLVERVVLLGAPVPARDERWAALRKVVAGRFVNGFCSNDWTLGLLYRTRHSLSLSPSLSLPTLLLLSHTHFCHFLPPAPSSLSPSFPLSFSIPSLFLHSLSLSPFPLSFSIPSPVLVSLSLAGLNFQCRLYSLTTEVVYPFLRSGTFHGNAGTSLGGFRPELVNMSCVFELSTIYFAATIYLLGKSVLISDSNV